MSKNIPSFKSMQNYKFGFGRALYIYLSTILSMPHSFKYEELDKNTIYYGLYCVIAMRVPDIKSYKSMLISEDVGGVEKELYLAAEKINSEEEYELIINKTDSLGIDSSILYPSVHAVNESLLLKSDVSHGHEIEDVNNLSSKLNNLDNVDIGIISQINELNTKKQDKLVSGSNIKKIKVNNNTQDIIGEGIIEINTGGSGGTTSYNELDESTLPKINEVMIKGAKTAAELGLSPKEHSHEISEVLDLENILNLVTSEKSTVFVKEESDEFPSSYKKGDILVVKKSDKTLINLKCCITNSAGSYSENDWMIINTGGGGGGGISTYAEAPDKPEIEGHVLQPGNNTFASLNIAEKEDLEDLQELTISLENQVDKFKEDVGRMETTIGSVGVRIDTVEDNVDAVNSKICTDFYKTSTIKSPSCKAIADYIDTVLADLDGSEVSF